LSSRCQILAFFAAVIVSGCARYEFHTAGPSSAGNVKLGWRLDRLTGEVCLFAADATVRKWECQK
jgi:hypothetical protein